MPYGINCDLALSISRDNQIIVLTRPYEQETLPALDRPGCIASYCRQADRSFPPNRPFLMEYTEHLLWIKRVLVASVIDLAYFCLAKIIVLTFTLSSCHSNDVYHPLSVYCGLDAIQCSLMSHQHLKKNRFCLFSK